MSLSELSYSVLEKKYDNFITPAMVMKINNIPISKLPGIYVSQVQVQLSLESSCSASFTLEKVYDLETRTFYSAVKANCKLGSIVSIGLGYGSSTKMVFYGYIHELAYSYSDAPSISVTALDVRRLMMINQENRTFNDKSCAEIFKTVASKYKSVYQSLKVDLITTKEERVVQLGSDYDFIQKELCKRANKEFFVLAGTVYFQERSKNPIPLITLEWGENLFQFQFRQTYSNEEIVVYGIDEKKMITIKEKVKADGSSKSLTTTPIKTEIVTPNTEDKKKLERIAESEADKKKSKSKTGSGSCIGLPELVPGRYINIKNLGIDSGTLKAYISSVKHSFDTNGFTTDFELGGD